MLERLHKVLARAGVAALRPAEDMIMAGRVTVNGRVVRELGARVDPEADVIAVDGQLVEIRKPSDPHRYVMVHKPVGVISTAQDTHERPTVVGLVPTDQRLFPVGRLDADSEGLILLTDDGDLAYRLTHPRFEIEKEYRVLLDRAPTIEDVRAWREGVELEGAMTMPAWVEVLERTPAGTWIRVVMREGRKRQIREIARILGYDVLRLIRVREGPLSLGELASGAWRDLTPAEVQTLRAHTQHIPSRAADEEAERRMADRNRPEGRRLRVIRGLRRPENDERAPTSPRPSWEGEGPRESFGDRRSYNYDPPSFSHADREQQPSDENRPRPEQRSATGERRSYDDQRRPPRDFNRSGDSGRRSPRGQDDRFREGGYRERSEQPYNPGPRRDAGQRGQGYSERSGNQRDFGNRGPADNRRGYGERANRPSDQRGYGNRGPSDNRRGYGNNSERSGNQRDFGNRGPADNRRGYGERADRPSDQRDFGNRGPSDNRRSGPGQGGRGYSERRGSGQRGDYGEPSNYRERRDYQQRSNEPRSRDGGPRGYSDQRSERSGNQRDFGNQRGGPPRQGPDRRPSGDAPRDRGPRGEGERRGGSSYQQRGPARGQGPARDDRWGNAPRSGSGPNNRSGGGFGGSSRGGGSNRSGGGQGARSNRPGGSFGGPARGSSGSRPQRPGLRGQRKGRNNG